MWGFNSRRFSCNYVFIDYLGSDTTGHLVTHASIAVILLVSELGNPLHFIIYIRSKN